MFQHGDKVRVIPASGNAFEGSVDALLEWEDGRRQLRVDLPEHGTCRYQYDSETNLWADAQDDDLQVAVRHVFEPGDRAVVHYEGSLRPSNGVVTAVDGTVSIDVGRGQVVRLGFDHTEGFWLDAEDPGPWVSVWPERNAGDETPCVL